MMITNGEGFFAQDPENLNIVANQYDYDLSSLMTYTPIKLSLVERAYSTEWITLPKWQKTTGTFYETGIGSGEFFPSYRLRSSDLVFNQMPNFAQTNGFRVEGYKIPTEMSADGDTPESDFALPYQNMAVVYATIGCIEAKGATGMVGDPAAFRARLDRMELQFIETITRRSDSRESVDPFVVSGEDAWG